LHLDGARVFNAAVKLGVPVHTITQHFDSVSICLSKGLGAPVGSVLSGSTELINKARRWRKVLGGGMRQAGILAAAGIVALNDHVDRLADDHANAKSLALGLADIDELSVDPQSVQTNMVFVSLDQDSAVGLQEHLKRQGILISTGATMRLVTHLDVSADDIHTVIGQFKEFFAKTAH
jgi:threonine aldolase